MKLALSLGATGLCALSFGSFVDNFESETGTAAGTSVTGQNSWYNPIAGSFDGLVYTYSGNTHGFPANSTGGAKFLGAASTDGINAARAQHDVTFSGGVWTMSFDFIGHYEGIAGQAVDNLGSVSLQPAGVNFFQTIYQWGALNPDDSTFNANIGVATAAGGGLTFTSPGAAWANLPVNHWYHQTITWDFGTNLITDTTIKDITTGGSVNDFVPTGWYLSGGAGNVLAQAPPTAVRFFAGGGIGNVMGYDNLNVAGPVPEPASMAVLGMGVLALIRKRRKA